jgi:S-adenosylmethionine hydrolase
VLAAALVLTASYHYFPVGTIFLVVVDPGVGSSRRAIAVEAGDYKFVGPDNGVLSVALEKMPARQVVELSDPRYARSTVSRTFEGRDRFAPAAAWLACGLGLAELGQPVGSIVRLDLPKPTETSVEVVGEVLQVDRFGNLTTNIGRQTLERFARSAEVTVSVGAGRDIRVVSTYADVEPGHLCALVGSSEYLEIAVNGGSAAITASVTRGAPVHVRRGA